MELIYYLVDLILHLDKHIYWIVNQYGTWTYIILFLVIFCETGLVITPFLPGDSLLFAIGAFAATTGGLSINLLFVLLTIAAIFGDTANYSIGAVCGPKVFNRERSRFLNKEHLNRTHSFYEKYGGKTIIIARFIPIIRTFAPFVAGIGRMAYLKFLMYNVVGGIIWIGILIYAGYFFGNREFVKRNFSLVIAAIIVISILPAFIEYLRHKKAAST